MKKKAFNSCRVFAMALAATVAGMTTTSCEKDDIEPEQPKIQKHSEYLNFYPFDSNPGTAEYPNDVQKIMDTDYIADLLKRDDVDTVYFRACGGREWRQLSDVHVVLYSRSIKEFAQQNPSRIRGTGEMNFKLGEASNVPADSAWLANFGFSINKNVK